MLSGEIRNQVDSVWLAFATGGIANPLEVIERWSRFKHFAPAEMYTVVGEHVFPFLRTLGGDDSTYAHHMKGARFTIPTPGLLAKVVDTARRRADGGARHRILAITNPHKWPQENLESFFHFRTGKLDSNAANATGQFPFFT